MSSEEPEFPKCFNPTSERILGVSEDKVYDCKLYELTPALSLRETLITGEEDLHQIVRVGPRLAGRQPGATAGLWLLLRRRRHLAGFGDYRERGPQHPLAAPGPALRSQVQAGRADSQLAANEASADRLEEHVAAVGAQRLPDEVAGIVGSQENVRRRDVLDRCQPAFWNRRSDRIEHGRIDVG